MFFSSKRKTLVLMAEKHVVSLTPLAVRSCFYPARSFVRTPMTAFVDHLTVRSCAESGLDYGVTHRAAANRSTVLQQLSLSFPLLFSHAALLCIK